MIDYERNSRGYLVKRTVHIVSPFGMHHKHSRDGESMERIADSASIVAHNYPGFVQIVLDEHGNVAVWNGEEFVTIQMKGRWK